MHRAPAGQLAAVRPAVRADLGIDESQLVVKYNTTEDEACAAAALRLGTRRLGAFWGYQAGWAFVVGKSASRCRSAGTATL